MATKVWKIGNIRIIRRPERKEYGLPVIYEIELKDTENEWCFMNSTTDFQDAIKRADFILDTVMTFRHDIKQPAFPGGFSRITA